METTTIDTLTEVRTERDEKVLSLIRYFRLQLKNHMYVCRTLWNKNSILTAEERTKIVNDYPFDFQDSITLTLIHIIHNRLRRGNVRPHLESVEIENQFIKEHKYEMDSLINKLNKKGYEVSLYENVYNA